MIQYNPVYKAYDYPEISRRITREEYIRVVKKAKEMGLTNLDIQGYWWLRKLRVEATSGPDIQTIGVRS
jgi:putative pyruvate formate lyase activating enzyme